MTATINLKILDIKGFDSETIEKMVNEVKNPSNVQKISEELYREKLKSEDLENKILVLKDDRAKIKRILESAIKVIISTAYETANDNGKEKLDKFKQEAAEILKISDALEIFIGE